MSSKKKNSENERKGFLYTNNFLAKPRFIGHIFFVIGHVVVLMVALWDNNWPKYCASNSWAFFMHVGLVVSATILSLITLLTYILFEDLNWVLMCGFSSYYGFMLTTISLLYIADGLKGCAKCEIRIREDYSDNPESFVDVVVLSDGDTNIEQSVAYLSLIFGIIYLLIFIYYLLRKEKA